MLTGERRVLRADIMLDAGNSLSPAIDAGQASLGFISLHQHAVDCWQPALPLQCSCDASFASALQPCHVHMQLQEHHCLVIVKTSFQSECGVYMA